MIGGRLSRGGGDHAQSRKEARRREHARRLSLVTRLALGLGSGAPAIARGRTHVLSTQHEQSHLTRDASLREGFVQHELGTKEYAPRSEAEAHAEACSRTQLTREV